MALYGKNKKLFHLNIESNESLAEVAIEPRFLFGNCHLAKEKSLFGEFAMNGARDPNGLSINSVNGTDSVVAMTS